MTAAPVFRTGPVRVRVPATSANLGPGFDSAALALGLHDETTVTLTDEGLSVEITGEGAKTLPRDEAHLVVRALHAGFDHLGGRPPGLAVRCHNRIPHGRGLGSSAAAIVGGLAAARALVEGGEERLDTARLLAVAAGMEGHPDNVAACLLGGLTLAWTEPEGARALRAEPAAALLPVLFVPEAAFATSTARRLLPAMVPHADAAANAARAGLLVQALTRRPDLLLPATEDHLHQPYRSAAMPETAALVAGLRAAGVAAVVSGAGPSVLGLTTTPDEARRATALAGPEWSVHVLQVDRDGLEVASGHLRTSHR